MAGWWFSLGTSVSSTKKTNHQDIICIKVRNLDKIYCSHLINTIYNVLIIVIYHYNMLGQDLFWSISTLADPNANPNFNLTLTLLFSYPHGYEMKGYVKCVNYYYQNITIFRGPSKQILPFIFDNFKRQTVKTFLCPNLKRYYS